MPTFFGIPLIGLIQMGIGAVIVAFIAVRYLMRPKGNRPGEYLIQDVQVIVGDGSTLEHQNVYIRDGKIKEVTAAPLSLKRVQCIDGTGKTLMPGLIDSHVHIQGLNNRSDADSERFLSEQIPEIFHERVLPYGITTVKDLCAPRHFIYRLRDQIRTGKIMGPELLAVGPNFTAPEGHPANTLGGKNPWIRREMAIEVTTPEQVHAGIEELAAAGVDFLKLTYQGGDYWYFGEKLQIAKIGRSLMEQIIREGKEKGLKTTAHVFYEEDVRQLLQAGIYGIEHGILDREISAEDEIVQLWKESGAHFVPTVNAMTYEKNPDYLKHSMHNLKVLYDAGIPIAMGTDNMLETMGGDVEHRELAYYVEAGLTPMQAIVLATKGSAEHLGIGDRKGQVRVGMDADLILLEKDPAEDISYLQFIDKVFLRGQEVYSQSVIQSYEIPDYRYPAGLTSWALMGASGSEERRLDVTEYETAGRITQTILRDGKMWATEVFEVALNLSATGWHYSRPSDGTELEAVREDGMIHLKGTFKGKPQEKHFKIGDGLWYQMMDLAMPAFLRSDQQEILFYSIGTGDNRGAMGLGEFAARKLGQEQIKVNGTVYDCEKVSFVLTMFSWAWTGLYWYDRATGQLVQSGEKKGASVKVQYTKKE